MDLSGWAVAATAAVGLGIGYVASQRRSLRMLRETEAVTELFVQQRHEVALALGMKEYDHENALARVHALRDTEVGLPNEVR